MDINKIAAVGFGAAVLLASSVVVAESMTPIDFESYSLGSISGQDGWSGAVSPAYDQAVVANNYGFASFGTKVFRISDAVTSGSFGDWVFTKSLTNEAGETAAENATLSGGTRQKLFEAQFDIATTKSTQQPGLHISISPDRGDGARMSYLRFEDQADGVHVFFDDYKDNTPFATVIGDAINGCGNEDEFAETDIATLTRTPHTIKLTMEFVDGQKNDVVKVYVDGVLKITGTSWESYFNYCEGNPTRTVDSLIVQSRTGNGPLTNPANVGEGFLIDNVRLSSNTITVPTAKDQCKNDGWKVFTLNPFKNQGQCVSKVAHDLL